MSTQGAMSFAERLSTDEDFLSRASAAVEGKGGEQATQALIEFGATEGIEMTAEELMALRGAMQAVDELSDESLDDVAGGTTVTEQMTTVQQLYHETQGTSSDDTQLAQFQLQQLLQQQQQLLQQQSNISKLQQDTAKSIINNLR